MDYTLSTGSHATPAEGRCAMEWVAYIAGEPHSDAPSCVSPVLRHFGIALNDRMPDEWRQKLRPYLARMIGTAGDGLDKQRLFVLADWAVRVIAPMGLDARGREEAASRLRALPEVVDKDTAAGAAEAARAARAAGAACAAWAARAAGAAGAAGAAEAAEAEIWQSALNILDRLLPTEAIQLPAEAKARAVEVCHV